LESPEVSYETTFTCATESERQDRRPLSLRILKEIYYQLPIIDVSPGLWNSVDWHLTPDVPDILGCSHHINRKYIELW